MSFPFVKGLNHFKTLLSPDHSPWWARWIAQVDSHEDVVIPLPQNAKGRAALPKFRLELVECSAYLVGGWINIVLEEEKSVPDELLFLLQDCALASSYGEGIGRPLFLLISWSNDCLQS